MSGYRASTKERNAAGELTIGEQNRRHRAWADEQPTVTRCGLCDWSHTGEAAVGRALFAEHRRNAHADIPTLEPQTSRPVAARPPDPVEHEEKEDPMGEPEQAQEQPHGVCKIDGCDRPALSRMGAYAKLCDEHAAEAKQRRANVQRPAPAARAARKTTAPPPATSNGHKPDWLEQHAQELQEALRELQRLNREQAAARQRMLDLTAEIAKGA